MDPFSPHAVRGAYDVVADDYAVAFGDELDDLPLDREMLDAALSAAGGDGWVLEAGCGPAPAARYLAGRIAGAVGIDLSGAMLRVAQARNPALHPLQGDLRQLALSSGSCSLVVAYYSLQHLPRPEVHIGLAELRRVLHAQGALVVAAHLGEGDVYVDEFLGHQVDTFAGALYRREELLDLVLAAGFRIELERQRGPLPHEYESQRLYLLARPAG